MSKIKIALVDDEALFRDGIAAILSKEEDLSIIGSFSDGPSFIASLDGEANVPDVVLLDLKMQPIDGAETAKQIRVLNPKIHIIIVSSYYRPSFIEYMIQLGISSFLPKNIDPKELIYAINTVYLKGIYLTDEHVTSLRQLKSVKSRKPDVNNLDAPSSRELEVLKLICEELTTKEISEKLFISARTVDGHRNNLLAKTGAKNTAGLVIYGMMHGIVELEEKILLFTLK
jgi:DNA-binding NarL/FixJ family response regulator